MKRRYNVAVDGSKPDSQVFLDGVRQRFVTAFLAGSDGWVESFAAGVDGRPYIDEKRREAARNPRLYGRVTVTNDIDFAWTLE